MSMMAIGACVLGYADPDVDGAVKAAIDAGSASTLNAPEEVELAELLCELHPWADMVRYARAGGEAMMIAVRIARAHTRRDKVAFSGYHGWCDWYLAANLADEAALDGQLMPGLDPAGVPRGLKGTALPFHYNRLDQLKAIVDANRGELGAIVMEPQRGEAPAPGFLEAVRDIATDIGAVLIFDEVTTGWRMTDGGIHTLLGVNPDIAVFAKAMANGYPMAAIIGTSPVMEAAQSTFISSTNWTERVGTVGRARHDPEVPARARRRASEDDRQPDVRRLEARRGEDRAGAAHRRAAEPDALRLRAPRRAAADDAVHAGHARARLPRLQPVQAVVRASAVARRRVHESGRGRLRDDRRRDSRGRLRVAPQGPVRAPRVLQADVLMRSLSTTRDTEDAEVKKVER